MTHNETNFDQDCVEYVGFWPRFGASIIDTIILLLITVPVLVLMYGSDYFYGEQASFNLTDLTINYLFPLIATVIFWIYKAATPGKMAISTKIIAAKTGEPPTPKQAIIRYVAYYISAIPLGLGFIWIAFDPRKQGWHDKIAGTLVIRSNAKNAQLKQDNQNQDN